MNKEQKKYLILSLAVEILGLIPLLMPYEMSIKLFFVSLMIAIAIAQPGAYLEGASDEDIKKMVSHGDVRSKIVYFYLWPRKKLSGSIYYAENC